MKLNRKFLRKIILNEIKNLRESYSGFNLSDDQYHIYGQIEEFLSRVHDNILKFQNNLGKDLSHVLSSLAYLQSPNVIEQITQEIVPKGFIESYDINGVRNYLQGLMNHPGYYFMENILKMAYNERLSGTQTQTAVDYDYLK